MKADLKETVTDELVAIREHARIDKNFLLSDQIRIELDSRGSIVIDTEDGQTVYHLGEGYDRAYLISNLKDIDNKFKRV